MILCTMPMEAQLCSMASHITDVSSGIKCRASLRNTDPRARNVSESIAPVYRLASAAVWTTIGVRVTRRVAQIAPTRGCRTVACSTTVLDVSGLKTN